MSIWIPSAAWQSCRGDPFLCHPIPKAAHLFKKQEKPQINKINNRKCNTEQFILYDRANETVQTNWKPCIDTGKQNNALPRRTSQSPLEGHARCYNCLFHLNTRVYACHARSIHPQVFTNKRE